MEFMLENVGLREPEDWSPATDLEAASEVSTLGGAPCGEDSLLRVDECLSGHTLGLSLLGPADSLEAVDHFPCIADELEEQAKQLEEGWFSASQAPGVVGAAVKLAQAHLAALATSKACNDCMPEAGAGEAHCVATPQQQQQQQPCTQQQEGRPGLGPAEGLQRQASGVREEPITPQRHSAGDGSSWNESPPPCGLDAAEVESPAPSRLLQLPAAPPLVRPPLGMAILNAQSVRLGRQPSLGAWRGCGRSPWCSLPPRHRRACDSCASVPGLLAYPADELFQSGVNVEELCRVPHDLLDVPAPDTESEGEGARATADCLSSGKRRADDEDDGASHSQSGAAACTSSGSPGAAMEQQDGKRMRLDACVALLPPLDATTPPLPLPELLGIGVAAAPAAELICGGLSGAASALVHGPMVPVGGAAPAPAASTPSCGMPPFAPSVPPPACGAAYLRNLGRPAGAPRLRPLPVAPPPLPAPAAPASNTPSKPVTRQKNSHAAHPGALPAAPRTSGRKAVMQWHTDSVTDPRTGALVTHVQPGTFCTQCYALSTPVWRAGPFGHKTLCNACGVRWMKYAKGNKK